MSLNQSFASTAPTKSRYLNTIDFEVGPTPSAESYVKGYGKNIVGEFWIDGKRFPVTVPEINHIIDTLERAKEVHAKKYQIGI